MFTHEVVVRIVDRDAGEADTGRFELFADQPVRIIVLAIILAFRPARVVRDVSLVAPVREVAQMPETDLRVGSVNDPHRVDHLDSGFFHGLEALPVAPVLGVHQPPHGAVEVEEVHPSASSVELLQLGQFVLRRPFARRIVHGAKVETAAQLDGNLVAMFLHQPDQLPELFRPSAVDLVHVEFDARQMLLHKRPFGVRAQQVGDPLTRTEPDFGWRAWSGGDGGLLRRGHC